MPLPDHWPAALKHQLEKYYGLPTRLERLSAGQSGAEVYRAIFSQKSLILKTTAHPAEPHFYQTAAPLLRVNHLSLPALELLHHSGELYWLLLEDIPHPFPRERWKADPALLHLLYRLHTLALPTRLEYPGMYQPQWTDEINQKALACLPEPKARRLKGRLSALRQKHQYLFEPQCLISGDPNPSNWGLRDDGTPVLFDWERFTYGTPALDLGITVPGLGDQDTFHQVAVTYLQTAALSETTFQTWPIDRLTQAIAAAKLWSVLEYFSFYTDGKLNRDTPIHLLVERFLPWIKQF